MIRVTASTTEELGDNLADSLQWRRSELQVLRSQVRSIAKRSESSPAGRSVLRSSVVLIYAHWEGFVKQACQSYLDYVAIRKLKYNELAAPLVETSVRGLVARASSNTDDLTTLARLVVGTGDARASIPRKGVVETRSNLRHDVLVDILGALGLEARDFSTEANLIDRELCDTRNDIAHGKNSFPDVGAVEQLFDRVLDMMERLRDLVMASAATKAYRARSD